MLLELLLALLLGIIAGTITGIIPGIHINLVAMLLFASSAFFLQYATPLILATFIVSMSITHTFLDFVPSIFLGAPDEDTALSVLPGHKMLMEGKGYGAVKLTVIGSFFGLLIALALTPFFVATSPLFYPFLVKVMAWLLIAMSVFLIFSEQNKSWALIIFLLSGVLGYSALNFMAIKQALFPLFSGLFGASLLTMSFMQNVKIPKQKIQDVKVEKKEVSRTMGLSIIASSLVSFLPGIGSAQAAVIASAVKKFNEKTFLVMLGAVNTIVLCLSFVALYTIQKPRSGVAVFVGKFLPAFTHSQLWFLLLAALIAGSIAIFLTLFFAKVFARGLAKLNYKWLCFAILAFIIVLSIVFSGPLSLLVLIPGAAIGIITTLVGVKKIQMMGCLLLPVILGYLI
jgi:putative membrane protein